MADYNKILTHPDKDDLISQLVNGVSPKEIAQWLKVKYDSKPELRLSAKLLKDFSDNNIDLYQQLNKDLDSYQNGTLQKKIAESLMNNKTYRERLAELGDKEIDVKKSIQQTLHILQGRLEQIHDVIQQNPGRLGKGDYALDKVANTVLIAIEKCDKIVNNKPDQLIQHNISVQMVEDYTTIFQDAIKEVLMEMDTEFSNRFMELLGEKLMRLKSPEQAPATVEARLIDAHKLTQTLVAVASNASAEMEDSEEPQDGET